MICYKKQPDSINFVRLSFHQICLALHLLPFGDCAEMQSSASGADGVDEWMRKSRFAHKAQVGDCLLTLDDQRNVQIERIVKVSYFTV